MGANNIATNIASLMAVIGADLTGLNNGLREAESKLGGFGSKMQSIGSSLLGAGAGMTAAVTAPLVAAGVGMANAAGQFEAAVNIMGVAARASGTSIEDLSAAALRVGADTELVGIDAMQAADAMTTFYKAGMETTDIFGDLNAYLNEGASLTGALRASIDLAAASDLELAGASEAVAIAMATFGLSAEDAVGIANSFVGAADASIANVSDLTAAMANIGPTAAAFGWSLNETNQALAILSERGIMGAEAGTALKSMLTNMQRDTPDVTEAWAALGTSLYDAEGNMRDMYDVLGDMEKGMAGMTEQQRNLIIQQLAGTYGMKALNTLLADGAAGWEEMAMKMEGAATAEDVGAERTRGFAAAMEQLKGSIQTFMITAGTPLIQALTPIVQRVTEIIGKLAEADPKFIQIGLVIAGVAAAIGPLLLLLGGIATGLGALVSPIGLIIAGVAALAAAFAASQGGIGPMIETLRNVGDTITRFLQPILDGLSAFWSWLWPYLSQLFKDIWRDLSAFFGPLIADMASFFEATFGRISAWIYENMPLIKQTIVTILNAIQAVWDKVWPYMRDALTAVWTVMEGVIRTSITMILGILKAVMQAINGDWDAAWQTIQDTLGNAWASMTGAIRDALVAVKGTFGQWLDVGKELIGGFIQGVRDKAGELINTVRGAVNDAISAAKNLLGIGSPSKLFADIGQNTMKGMAMGIGQGARVPAASMQSAMAGVTRSATVNYNSSPIISDRATGLQLLAMTRSRSLTALAEGAI